MGRRTAPSDNTSDNTSVIVLWEALTAELRVEFCAGFRPATATLSDDGVSVATEQIDMFLADFLTDPQRASTVRAALAAVQVPSPLSCSSNNQSVKAPSASSCGQEGDDVQAASLEPLTPITSTCALIRPHAYTVLGAPYGAVSPFQMRLSAVQQLAKAQDWLSKVRPGYRLQIFDAYRPIPVQAFMVDYALRQSLSAQGLSEAGYAADPEAPLHKKIRQRVSEIWANPSIDPANPPPHATGAAVDLTVIDSQGKPLDMGCPIDDLGPHAESNYYLRHEQADHPANVNRRLLLDCMNTAGFKRLPHEWWHFSYGDAWWALLGFLHDTLPLVSKAIAKGSSCPSYEGSSLLSPLLPLRARYGRVDVS